ncbi:putative ribonuclease h2 subunit a [Phaeomoniella chlamydospora]|uniref:Ribonuclease n=1 Tax=Phaeomoniella chlamydospora TaxID=158046 RepID=A0A0G2H0K4_PHACM|nr:putative ribonuclease h2 subunit a [Phaeomoniella chlamydospora]
MGSQPSDTASAGNAFASTSIFLPASIHTDELLRGDSYAHYTPVPSILRSDDSTISSTPCVLGIDEAGRGPVLGPMVYSAFYLPVTHEKPLLASAHHFNDSKQLTLAYRNTLMRLLGNPSTDLHNQCGWAIKSLSARDISSSMLRPNQYNLNSQAYDATIEIIKGVINQGVNITEIYVDTVGRPETYQKRLSLIFPTIKVTVEKKADAKFPCVSAASVVAKVTRDISLEVLWGGVQAGMAASALQHQDENTTMTPAEEEETTTETVAAWGSGYPSDGRCTSWLKSSMDPLFGWGPECRFSWGTAKDMLEPPNKTSTSTKVDWQLEDGDDESSRVTQYFSVGGMGVAGAGGTVATKADVLRNWFGGGVGKEVF